MNDTPKTGPRKKPNTGQKSKSLGMVIQARVKQMGSNPRQLAAQMGYAYDHIRKVYNGQDFPGPKLMDELSLALKLDREEMQRLVDIDKAIDKGYVGLFTAEDEFMIDLKRYWPHLSPRGRQEIVELAKVKYDAVFNSQKRAK